MSRSVLLFAEDSGHEQVVTALVERIASSVGVDVVVDVRSATRGLGTALEELRRLARDIRRDRERLPDLIVAAIDANCHGFNARRSSILDAAGELAESTVCAIPDPHVERWLLLDSAAFKAILGRGCTAPDQKCDKGRYKRLLLEAVREAGLHPLNRGLEHARDLIMAMDLERVALRDPSLGHFVKDLRACLQAWR